MKIVCNIFLLCTNFLTVVNENVSLVISRQLLTDVSSDLASLPDPVSQDVSHFALDVIQPRVISFEEQVKDTLCSLVG